MQPNPIRLKLHQPARYRICVQGLLDESWAETFASLAITCDRTADPGPVTILTGPVIDQAMLLGVLNGLYSLGLCLLCVEVLADDVSVDKADCLSS